MPALVDDPAQLSISRLKSDLIAHNVTLPPAKSRKQVYVELHLKHVERRNAEFSSDEEQHDPEDGETVIDPSVLTDDDLKAALLAHGFNAGPIVASTRSVYENKLRKLLQPVGLQSVNGVEESEQYSDSEDEESKAEEEEEDDDDDDDDDDQELGSRGTRHIDLEVQGSRQVQLHDRGDDYVYPQCFMPSPRLHPQTFKTREHVPKQNSGNALKSSARSGSTGIKRTSSVEPQPGTGLVASSGPASNGSTSSPKFFSITEMVEEMETKRSLSSVGSEPTESNVPEHWSQSSRTQASYSVKKEQSVNITPQRRLQHNLKEPLKDPYLHLVPDLKTTPSGIYATRRRPIKGASKRPVLYDYPDCPLSPTTRARLEVERRVVPTHILVLVFLLLTCLLYVIYTCVEDCSFSEFVALLDGLKSWSENQPGPLLPLEMQETPANDIY